MNLSKTVTKLLILYFVFITIESFGASGIVSITDNGMHVFTKQVKSAPIISMSFWVRAGSVNDVIGREGYANLVRKLVLDGTDKNQYGQLDKKLRDIGATYSSFTLTDYTCFSFNFPSSQKKEVIKLTCDAIFNSNFSAENVEREKKICVQELKAKSNNPNKVVQDMLMANAFKKHPYKSPVKGTVGSIIASDREGLYRFYKKYYVPANIWLVAVGDLSHEEIIDIVRKEVSPIPKVSAPIASILKEEPQKARRSFVKYGNLNNSYICLGWHVPEAKNKDSVVLDVISMLLSGRNNSKINELLVKNDKVGFAAGIAYFTSLYPSLFMVAGIASQGNTAEFIDRAVEYVCKLKEDDSVSAAELDKAKKMIISNYIFNNESVEAQSQSYGFYAMISNINDQEKYIENVKKVTLPDIQRVAKEYFNDNNLTIARYEPTIVSDDSKPVMLTLDNGVRLILKEDHSSPIVSIVALVGAGTAREHSNETGVANITSKLIFNESRSQSGESLVEKLDSLGARINTDVSHSFVSFDMRTLPKSFIQSLEFFIENLTSSKFSEDEIKQVKAKAIAELEVKEQQPFIKMKNTVIDEIFPKSSLSTPLQGTKREIKRISRSKIKSFHKKNYVGSNIVIAIVGDFFVRENKEKILEVLGEIGDGKVKDYKLLKIKSISKDKILKFKINTSEGQVVFVSPTFPVNDERNYGMQIVNRVLMNNMKGNIEKELKCKAVSYKSENVSVVNGGYFISTTTLPAQLVGSCTEILKKEFEKIRNNGLSKKDIEEAKNMLRGQYLLIFSTNSTRGLIMSADEIVGKGFDSYLKYSDNIASTSKSIVDNIAKTYLPASGTYLIGITKP